MRRQFRGPAFDLISWMFYIRVNSDFSHRRWHYRGNYWLKHWLICKWVKLVRVLCIWWRRKGSFIVTLLGPFLTPPPLPCSGVTYFFQSICFLSIIGFETVNWIRKKVFWKPNTDLKHDSLLSKTLKFEF